VCLFLSSYARAGGGFVGTGCGDGRVTVIHLWASSQGLIEITKPKLSELCYKTGARWKAHIQYSVPIKHKQ